MFGQNKEQSRKRWESYRRIGKLKFILFFAVYFSLALSIVNFLMEFTIYGYASPYMAVIRFITYMIVSPIMGVIIWNVSEKKYHKS